MSKIIYFAKVNLNTGDTFESYNANFNIIQEKMNKLASDIKSGIKYTHKYEYKSKGETFEKTEDFEFGSVQRIYIEGDILIIGDVIKTSKIYINKVIKETGEVKVKAVDNDEIIRFAFYPKKEIIAYNCTNRFGYKKFIEAIEGLINNVNDDSFVVKIKTNGVSIENLRGDLKKLKAIKELRIETIIPNPTLELMEAIKKGKENLEKFEKSRVTEKTSIFKSNDKKGLDLDSEQVTEEINNTENIHSALTAKETTSNGYVTVIAIDSNGTIYNTNTEKVIKHEIEDYTNVHDFANHIRGIILQLF